MSQTFVAPPRARTRLRLLCAALLAAGVLALLIGRRATTTTTTLPAPVGPARLVCEGDGEAPPPPPEPRPSLAIWDALNECLHRSPDARAARVTVAQVRHWVEVEHDPIWLDGDRWWVPLSGEGLPDYPSGWYVGVALVAGGPPSCEHALVN